MDRLSAPEQNAIGAYFANLLRKVEQDSGPEFLPRGLDVMGLVRQLALPSAETVEKLSYGDPLFRMPTQSNIPITTDRGYVAEVLGMAPAVPAASRATTRISNEMADQLVKAIMGNPQATAPAVLEAAGQMAPLARMFKPEEAKKVIPKTKIVDESGDPQLVYHGTGQLTDEDEAIKEFQTFNPAWFAKDTSTADLYANTKGLSPTVYPSYLDIRNPLEIKVDMNAAVTGKGSGIISVLRKLGLDEDRDFPGYKSADVWEIVNNPRFMEAAMDSGYDGIKVREGGKETFAVFDASQVKSAISDPDIEGLLEP
jgi:hypothetical protein